MIPVLNEEASLAELVGRIIPQVSDDYEIVFLDDGSTDRTFEILTRMHAENERIRVVRHYSNHGKSLALMNGFSVARGDVLITMDGDLQDMPEMIPRFLAKIEEGFDFVNGWRSARADTWAKRSVSQLFNTIARLLFSCTFSDINCGFKAYRRTVYQNIKLHGDLHRLIPVLVAWGGFRCAEVKIEHAPRKHGRSRYSLFRHRGILDIIALMVERATQHRPFHIFCEAGFVFAILSVVFTGIWGINRYWLLPTTPLGDFLTFIVGALAAWFLMLATIMPMFGFLMELLARAHQQNHWQRELIRETLPRDML